MGLTLDKRGRLVIPKDVRDRLGLKADQTMNVEVRDGEVVLKPAVNAEKFIEELRGCVHGSRIRPGELKEIWGIAHAHH